MIKVLVADESQLLTNRLTFILSNRHEIKSCTTIDETKSTLSYYQPDILVIDTEFMNGDIIHVINEQAENGNCPRIITLTHLASQDILNSLTCNTVDFIISKPCSLDFIVKSIGDIGHRIEHPDRSTAVTVPEINDILLDLGFSMAHKTFRLLSHAVLYRYDQPDCAMKELYVDVSLQCKTSPENVEKGIRDAINRAYKTGNPEAWARYIGTAKDNEKPFKGNSAFISKIVEYIKRENLFLWR